MIKYEIEELVRVLKSNFSNCAMECTILITGSVNRGDYITNDEILISDIDILIIIPTVALIDPLTIIIKPIIESVKFKYNCEITFVYALLSKVYERKKGEYLQSINKNFILYDHLNLSDFLLENNQEESLIDIIQTLTYYSSKFNYTRDNRLLTKLKSIIGRIQPLLSNDLNVCENDENLVIHILKSVDKMHDSSIYFLNNLDKIDPKALFENVRRLVCLENQGIDIERCFYQIEG